MALTIKAKLSTDAGNNLKFGTDGGLYGAPPTALSTATYTTGAVAAGASETGTVTLAWGYRVVTVKTSAAARVRLYVGTAARDADINRAVGTDPGYNGGVVLDVLTNSSTTMALTPEVVGHNLDSSASVIPITVTPTGAGPVTVTFGYLAV